MNELVSFIFVNRGGTHLREAIQNIKDVYSDLNKEIMVIEQNDAMPFMRGQLFNIGVKYANGTYIALSDNDIFHLRKVDWIDIHDCCNCPIIGWRWISQVSLNGGHTKITSTREITGGFGAFNFMKKSEFISFNGFSNLFIGYGGEDKLYATRFSYIRVPQNLGHITHPSHRNMNPKNLEYNIELATQYVNKIDKTKDGFAQTTFNENENVVINGVRYIKVSNISVTPDYYYTNLLDKHYKLLSGGKV